MTTQKQQASFTYFFGETASALEGESPRYLRTVKRALLPFADPYPLSDIEEAEAYSLLVARMHPVTS